MEQLRELRVKNGLCHVLGGLAAAGPLADALLSLGVKGEQLKVLKLLGHLDEAKLEQLGRLLDSKSLEMEGKEVDLEPKASIEGVDLAQSALEDFINCYFMFHGLDPESGTDVLRYLPTLGFLEAHIYELDQQNEDFLHPELPQKAISSSAQGLMEMLRRRTWLTKPLEEELRSSKRFWQLERKICGALRSGEALLPGHTGGLEIYYFSLMRESVDSLYMFISIYSIP